MILKDKVTVLRRVMVGRDERGNAIYEDVEVPYRAEVRPLTSQENPASGGVTVTTRHRVFLGRSAQSIAPTDALTWRGVKYEVQGDIEPHTIGGRLHHYEAIVVREGHSG